MSEYIFAGCKSGTDFENIAVEFLRKLRFKANKTGNNDGGIDVVATITFLGTEYKYYIQCKYYNKPLGKGPIQEVYAGSHYYDGEGNDKVKGRPVVMTNNRVTYDARVYAKRLGVEIIADTEWNEIKRVGTERRITDPNVRPGMLGIILSHFAQDAGYLSKVLKSMDTNEPEPLDNEALCLKIQSDFDEAEECMKEAAYLQEKAAKYSQKALTLQRDAIIRNLKYG